MTRVVLALCAVAIVVPALLRLDYSFYNPPRGATVAGRATSVQDPVARQVLEWSITDDDVRQFGGTPTIEKLATWFGVRETMACSVRRTFDAENDTLRQRPLSEGERVVLCLN